MLGDRNGRCSCFGEIVHMHTLIGFYTNRYNDLTGSEMKSTLKDVAAIDYKYYDCLLVAILTHGNYIRY